VRGEGWRAGDGCAPEFMAQLIRSRSDDDAGDNSADEGRQQEKVEAPHERDVAGHGRDKEE
jgi:hypothetical protein